MLPPGTDIGLPQGASTSVEEFSSLNEQPLTVMDHYQLRGSDAEGVQVRVVGFSTLPSLYASGHIPVD